MKFSVDSFHTAITPVIAFVQVFGIMPLNGLDSRNLDKLRFYWLSKAMFIAIAIMSMALSHIVLLWKYVIHIGITAQNMVSVMFYMWNFIAYLLFIALAKRWPMIVSNWYKFEVKFLNYKYLGQQSLSSKFKRITFIIGILALGEHGMYEISTIYTFRMKHITCNRTNNPIEDFYLESFYAAFRIFPYHPLISVALQTLQIACTVLWNFCDLFIILVSLGLSARFEQFYYYMRTKLRQERCLTEDFFREVRLDFVTLLNLLGYVDKELSFIILLSCVNNLYFICYQLMNIFKVLRYPINYAYFWYSLLFLIGRTAFLFITAASINEVSKMPARLLRNVPSHIWCEEADRFLYELSSETIGLSAMGFFHFTRGIVITMASTIITFEMVIMQFDQNSADHELPPLCG